jgi:hypothetical protein
MNRLGPLLLVTPAVPAGRRSRPAPRHGPRGGRSKRCPTEPVGVPRCARRDARRRAGTPWVVRPRVRRRAARSLRPVAHLPRLRGSLIWSPSDSLVSGRSRGVAHTAGAPDTRGAGAAARRYLPRTLTTCCRSLQAGPGFAPGEGLTLLTSPRRPTRTRRPASPAQAVRANTAGRGTCRQVDAGVPGVGQGEPDRVGQPLPDQRVQQLVGGAVRVGADQDLAAGTSPGSVPG